MAGRQSPAVIVHPFYNIKKRCASNRRYAVARVATYTQKWNAAKRDYDHFTVPVNELVVEKRTDSLTTAYDVFNKLYGLRPIIWDLVKGEVVREGRA